MKSRIITSVMAVAAGAVVALAAPQVLFENQELADKVNGLPTTFPNGIAAADGTNLYFHGDLVPVGSNTVVVPGVPGMTSGYGLYATTNGIVLAEKDHGSPKTSKAEKDAKIKAKLAKLDAAMVSKKKNMSDKQKLDLLWSIFCAQTGTEE